MKLSILIPVYNFDVREFVKELYKQCKELDLEFEILLIDDKSYDEIVILNNELISLNEVRYEKLQINIGRSKIRNLLLESALYSNCLVLDCDLMILAPHFIKKYIDSIKPNTVVVGGHVYSGNPPENKKKILHWKYGVEVESASLKQRLKNPYHSFKTNSFLLTKEVFDIIKFDESIIDYGHEDTLFGIELELNNIEIIHIDNPVIHVGLQEATVFLNKQKEAIENLLLIGSNPKLKDFLCKKSRLLTYEKSYLLNIYYSIISLYYRNRLYEKLLSDNPKMKTLNFWKFYTLKKIRRSL